MKLVSVSDQLQVQREQQLTSLSSTHSEQYIFTPYYNLQGIILSETVAYSTSLQNMAGFKRVSLGQPPSTFSHLRQIFRHLGQGALSQEAISTESNYTVPLYTISAQNNILEENKSASFWNI